MLITPHFTLEELIYSEIAIRKNIDNTPSQEIVDNLTSLCVNVLEPLRVILGVPIKVNSGYRSPLVNAAVGGVPTSQHCKGQAADTVAVGLTIKDYYVKVKELVKSGQLEADQVILEFQSWIHLSYNKGANRKEFLTIDHGTGYIKDLS